VTLQCKGLEIGKQSIVAPKQYSGKIIGKIVNKVKTKNKRAHCAGFQQLGFCGNHL